MKRCSDFNNIQNVPVGTLWYAILIAIGDPKLLIFHKQHVEESLKKNNLNDDKEILDYVKSQILKKYEFKDIRKKFGNVDYTCYITLESTEEYGGYNIIEHEIAPGIICKPNFVIKKEAFENLHDKHKECPICHANLLHGNMYRFIPPLQKNNDDESIIINEDSLLLD